MRKKILKILFILSLIAIFLTKDILYGYIIKKTNYDNVLDSYIKQNTDENIVTEYTNFSFESTQVLYRDIYDFLKFITIYKGENNEVTKGMAVVDENALIGIVENTTKETSQVKLLTHSETNISVKVGNAYGILKYVDKKLVITNLTSEDFKKEDIIYTSGYAKLYEGIKIGQIGEKQDSYETVYSANLLGNFKNIKDLVIIKDIK